MKAIKFLLAMLLSIAVAACGGGGGDGGGGGGGNGGRSQSTSPTAQNSEGSVSSPIVLTTSPRPSQVGTTNSYYTYTVPWTGSYKVAMTAMSADVDLYVYTNTAFTTSATCNPNNTYFGGTSPEDCTVSATAGQVLYIKANGSFTSNGATFTLGVSTTTPQPPSGQTAEGSIASPVALTAAPRSSQVDTTNSYYAYTVPSAGSYKVAATGLSDDVDLYVYTDAAFTTPATCNPDNTRWIGLTQEDCTVSATVGQVLYIRVHGLYTASGATFTLGVSAVTTPPPVGPVAEGSVASPIVLATSSPRSSQVGLTQSYYKYTVPSTGSYKVAITALSDDVDLFVATDAAYTMAVTCNPDNTLFYGTTPEDCTVSATAGQVLYILTDGSWTLNGATFTLSVDPVAPQAGPITIAAMPYNGTINASIPEANYTYTTTATVGTIQLTNLTNDLDPLITNSAFTLVDANWTCTAAAGVTPDTCTAATPVPAGTVLYIAVLNYAAANTSFTLNVGP